MNGRVIRCDIVCYCSSSKNGKKGRSAALLVLNPTIGSERVRISSGSQSGKRDKT